MSADKTTHPGKCSRVWLGIISCLLLFVVLNVVVGRILNLGLRRYYCLYPAEILSIGYSMSEMGIDKQGLETGLQVPVAKYCMNGAGIGERDLMLRHYLESVGQKPKILVYDVSSFLFAGSLAVNADALFYPFISESSSISRHLQQSMPPLEFWQKKLIPLSRYDDTRLGAVIRGFRQDWTTQSRKKFDPEAFQQRVAEGKYKKIACNPELVSALEHTLRFLGEENIQVVLLALPCVDLLNQAEPDQYEKVMDIYRSWAQEYSHVTFLDYNPLFSNDYDLFVDPIHLSRKGQLKVTEKLIEDLPSLLERRP